MRESHPHYVQDQRELLDKLWRWWETWLVTGTQTTPWQFKQSHLKHACCWLWRTQLGVSVFTKQDWAHMANVEWSAGQMMQPAPPPPIKKSFWVSAPPPQASEKQVIGDKDSPLMSEAGTLMPTDRPFTEPFSSFSGIVSACKFVKKDFEENLCSSSDLRRLPGSPLRSQTAHFPFSTTYCDKSDITSFTYLTLISSVIKIQAPYLVLITRVISPWRKRKGWRVCVTLTAARLQSLCVYSQLLTCYFMCALNWVGLFSLWSIGFPPVKQPPSNQPWFRCSLEAAHDQLFVTCCNLRIVWWRGSDMRKSLRSTQSHCDKTAHLCVDMVSLEDNRMCLKDIGLANFHSVKEKWSY